LRRAHAKQGNGRCLSHDRHGVWVPAFAGTTTRMNPVTRNKKTADLSARRVADAVAFRE
jgi:hypothetical protein